MDNLKWIWVKNCCFDKNVYADFYDCFTFEGETTTIKISADSNYAVYVNGVFVNSCQYPDFPHYKVYDSLDITSFCKRGKNSIGIIVWYYGMPNMSYYPGKPALLYAVYEDGKLKSQSDETTLSRISKTYESGSDKTITAMLGFSFHYDLTQEDDWLNGELKGFSSSVYVEQNLSLFERPIEKCIIENRMDSQLIKNDNNRHFIFDLQKETVGLLNFKLTCSEKQTITIAYGEYLENGGVHYEFPGHRVFTVQITLKAGSNHYFNPFRRFGLRYFEIFADCPVEIDYFSVCPTVYPVKKKMIPVGEPLRKRIYATAVKTLELCMHDHFEDCPWREQGLYGMDSRMEMLYSYYAFEDFRFARSNLVLMSKAQKRSDGLMPICCPSGDMLSIPTYALYYIIASYEYYRYSKDKTLLVEIYDKLKEYLEAFVFRIEDGLFKNWKKSSTVWNFYDWAPGFEGYAKENEEGVDAVANCLLILALEAMHEINTVLDKMDDYSIIADRIRKAMFKLFDQKAGLFDISLTNSQKSELVNSLVILSGVVKGEQACHIAEKLANESQNMIKMSLPLRAWKYDALMAVDRNQYQEYILAEIDTVFGRMLEAGATSFWETEEGTANCGSLCHAWSALPIYYYTVLRDGK